MTHPIKVFCSHNSVDKSRVKAVVERLARAKSRHADLQWDLVVSLVKIAELTESSGEDQLRRAFGILG